MTTYDFIRELRAQRAASSDAGERQRRLDRNARDL